MAKAVSDAECPPTELAEVLAQVCYERQLCDLQQRGISFSRSSIIPAPGQRGSSPAIAIHHADNQHKGKRLLCYVRKQQQQQQPKQPKQLISREVVLAAGVPLVNCILQPNTDPQCLVFKDVFFSMPELQKTSLLCARGHHETAFVMEIMGHADMAWDISGMTHQERLGRLLHLKQLLLTVLAPTFASVAQMHKSHVLGAPRDLLWAMLHNVDSYLLFAQRFPLLAEHAVARFWCKKMWRACLHPSASSAAPCPGGRRHVYAL